MAAQASCNFCAGSHRLQSVHAEPTAALSLRRGPPDPLSYHIGMSFPVNAINVMIASPDDVAAERKIVRKVIAEWNATHSTERGIVLLPVDWESNSSAEYGREPQSALNAQIQERADILIAIFWTRLGTPTVESRSGTIEEINRHTAKNKGAMLYFSSQPIPQGLARSGGLEDVDDYKKGIQKNCLYGTCRTRAKFKELVRRHLTKELQKPRYRTAASAPSSTNPNIETNPSASALLMAAAETDDGQILHMVTNEGASVRVGQEDSCRSNTRGKRPGGRQQFKPLKSCI